MAADTIISYLMCIDGIVSERKRIAAKLFIAKAVCRVQAAMAYILSDDNSVMDHHAAIIDRGEDRPEFVTP